MLALMFLRSCPFIKKDENFRQHTGSQSRVGTFEGNLHWNFAFAPVKKSFRR
jgi:hypothetical protein